MDTGIIVDESDIVKSSATKMEGIQFVRDGSSGKNNKLGYDLLNIIAYDKDGDGYQIKPLSSDLIARDTELDGVSQILEDRLIEITIASGNKGVYLFDRGYDERGLFGFLGLHDMNFIVRSMGIRNIIVGDKERPFKEVAKSVSLTTRIEVKENGQQIMCGLKRVKLRLDSHPKKHPETVELYLVVAKFSPNKHGKQGYFYFFCNFPVLPHLSDDQIMEKVIRMYRLRWKIEEVHKHIKQEYGWEDIQLTSYLRLKNMNQVLLLAMSYLYSLKRIAEQIMMAFPHYMNYSKKKWKKIYGFVYYKLSGIVSLCFAHVSRYNVDKFKGVRRDYMQLEIPCMKNGGM
ncbi:MAG: transposase [Candidatus Cloacimonadaceae bacterium]|nr:transposase [Candidatus Cloacimonadaceae bacterium]